METVMPSARGVVSGLLQSGYSSGYLLASVVYGLLYVHIGWRGMFMIAILPALLLIPFVYSSVPESPAFAKAGTRRVSTWDVLRSHGKLALYAIVLMTAFNFFSHGTQDFYPTFLEKGHGLPPGAVGTIAAIYNIGAVLGCFFFGTLSQRFGRRRMMITAAMLGVLAIGPWAYSSTLIMLTFGAFLINFCAQGAWSVIPAHLNELSPPGARGTFPGTVYQLGNLFAAINLRLQTGIAETQHSYSLALGSVAFAAAIAIALLLAMGPEAHGVEMRA
jgi:SHS family lactate transporter-like MFS transporter